MSVIAVWEASAAAAAVEVLEVYEYGVALFEMVNDDFAQSGEMFKGQILTRRLNYRL